MRYTRLEFMKRFSRNELVRIYSAAKTSVDVEIWLAKFNAATPDSDGTCIDTNDPETVQGILDLENAGFLDQGRTAADLLGTSTYQISETTYFIAKGMAVRDLNIVVLNDGNYGLLDSVPCALATSPDSSYCAFLAKFILTGE